MQTFLPTGELADRLRTSASTVRYWRHIGYGPSGFKIGRRVLYDSEAVEQWIARVRDEQGHGVDQHPRPPGTGGYRSPS